MLFVNSRPIVLILIKDKFAEAMTPSVLRRWFSKPTSSFSLKLCHIFAFSALLTSSSAFSAGAPGDMPVRQMVIVFGRPGAGKSTIAERASSLLDLNSCIALDLDVCVPQWMRDNFAQGIYPTLEQRQVFARDACQHVIKEMQVKPKANVVLISFSFVNEDLRAIFREEFPSAKWALLDVTPSEAQDRMQKREGHFYKGSPPPAVNAQEAGKSEWEFDPVSFEHTILPGTDSIEENARRVLQLVG